MPELNFDLVRTDPSNFQAAAYVIVGIVLLIVAITVPALVPDPSRHALIVGVGIGGAAGALVGVFVSPFFYQEAGDLKELAGQSGDVASLLLGIVTGAGGGAALGGFLGTVFRI